MDDYEIDAVLANFNPNSQVNDYNPNLSIYRHVDKSQLVTYTTEFCFEPTGIFEICSFGKIAGADGTLLSSSRINTVVKVFEFYRQSTQAQFLAGYDNEADLGKYFSESTSDLTAGAADGKTGYSLQSYPEPVNSANYFANSIYDGKLALATWQPELDDYQLGGLPEPSFRATFSNDRKPEDYGLNPRTDMDTAEPFGQYFFYDSEKRDGYAYNDPTNDRLTYPMPASDAVPGAIFPDGGLSDPCRIIAFPAGNFGKKDGQIAGLHFWIKPNFNTADSTRIRTILQPHVQEKCWAGMKGCVLLYLPNAVQDSEILLGNEYYSYSDFNPTHSFLFGWGYGFSPTAYKISSTVNHNFNDHSDAEHGAFPLYNFEGHQWNHIGLSWKCVRADPLIALTINGDIVPETRWVVNSTGRTGKPWYGTYFAPVISLGLPLRGAQAQSWQPWQYPDPGYPMAYAADSTYDDIIGYLGFIPDFEFGKFWGWGRYYNEPDATYTSPEINLHRELKLDRREILRPRSGSWTVYWPRNNRDGDEVVDNILPPTVNPDDPDDPHAEKWGESHDPISINIGLDDGQNTEWLYNDPSQMATYAGGSEFDITMPSGNRFDITNGHKFRYQVRFNLEPGQTLYDTPVFDDISFTFHIKPKILRWQVIN
ncbi:hypothetical protein ACFL54_05930 [Planctomycetota bacterium]